VLTIIEGKMGSGPTLVMAKLVRDRAEETGKLVFADAPFCFKYGKFDIETICRLSEEEKLKDIIIALDYKYSYWDSRSSQSKQNKLMAYLSSMSRKITLDIFLTVPTIHDVDLRLRRATDYRVRCGLGESGVIHISIMNKLGRFIRLSFNPEDLKDLISTKVIPLTQDDSFFEKSLGVKFSGLEVGEGLDELLTPEELFPVGERGELDV
jgi:hypothetical protein